MKTFILLLITLNTSLTTSLADTKMIIGKDNRYRITERNKELIHQSIGLVYMFYGKEYLNCTGTVIAPRIVLTAAHCFEPGVKDFYFIPGSTKKIRSNLRISTPLNAFKTHKIEFFKGYKGLGDDYTDIGLLIFDEDLNVPSVPLSIIRYDKEVVTISGYPADKPKGTMWEDSGSLTDNSYTLDTSGGQSGSAVRNIQNEIIGVHIYSRTYSKRNYALLLREEHIKWIHSFITN